MHDLCYPGDGSVLLMVIENSFSYWRHLKGSESCILSANILSISYVQMLKIKKISKVGVCFLGAHSLGARSGAVKQS